MNKQSILTCLGLLLILSSTKVNAQTPGSFEATTTTPPSGFTNTKTITPNALGVGRVKAPDAWQEIRYCPNPGAPDQKGLIITRELCSTNSGVSATTQYANDRPYQTYNLDPEGSTGGGATVSFSNNPVPIALGTIPFTYYSPFNPTGTNTTSPVLNLRSNQQPMFQVRTVEYPNSYLGNPGSLKSRFIVMPDGNSGFNTEDPRAALDVQDANLPNVPVAMFGNVLPFSQTGLPQRTNAGGAPINQTYTRHLSIVPRLNARGFNFISQAEDFGLFFTNGLGPDGSNTTGALVLAPYTKDQNAGGLRMEANGNTTLKGDLLVKGKIEVQGEMKCNGFKSQPKWWPDYVFEKTYDLMSLDSVSNFISLNKHLPGMPSRDSILTNGQDIGYIQQLQQQKIEELTLYTIEQKKLIEAQQAQLKAQEDRLKKLEALIKH